MSDDPLVGNAFRDNAFPGNTLSAVRTRDFANYISLTVVANTFEGNQGGVYADPGSAVTLVDNIFLGNSGEAVSAFADLVMRGNTIHHNHSEGGVDLRGGTAMLENNSIQGNSTVGSGGGVQIWNTTATLRNNTIMSNTASGDGGGVYVDGGLSNVTLISNTFEHNSAGLGGGLCVAYWGGSNVNVYSNTFRYNDARQGGGIWAASNGTAVINGNTVENNSAGYTGGIALGPGTVTLENNLLRGNTSSQGGGGLSVSYGSNVSMNGNTIISNTSSGAGGGVYILGGTVTARNDIIANNISPWEGIYVDDYGNAIRCGILIARHWTVANNGNYALTTYGPHVLVALTNTIVASHTIAGLWGQNIVADTTLFFNSGTPCGGGASCTNSLSGDPRFVAPAAGDYHIGLNSAARDQGVDAGVYTDIDGDPRPFGTKPDLGADEVAVTLSISKVGPVTVLTGQPIIYTLMITNSGVFSATGVVITDALPNGAHYVSGGTLMPGNVVSWTVANLAGNDDMQVQFVVTATQTITNSGYRVSCAEGVSATGTEMVVTNVEANVNERYKIYLPVILRAYP